MTFREARRQDVPALVEMIADDKLGATREDYRNPLPEEYYRAFDNIQRDENQELIVVEHGDGKIIGTLQLSFIQYLTYRGGVRAQIEAVRIHRDYRGQQIGEAMFSWAIARAKARGAHLLQLTTDKQRADALRFYERLCFRASHEGMKLYF